MWILIQVLLEAFKLHLRVSFKIICLLWHVTCRIKVFYSTFSTYTLYLLKCRPIVKEERGGQINPWYPRKLFCEWINDQHYATWATTPMSPSPTLMGWLKSLPINGIIRIVELAYSITSCDMLHANLSVTQVSSKYSIYTERWQQKTSMKARNVESAIL